MTTQELAHGTISVQTPNFVTSRGMKQVYVLQGVSGSGKSTLARRLVDLLGAVVVSADDYFLDPKDGSYNFDPSKLGQAHAHCFRCFLDALEAGKEVVVVDNTNTSTIEISPYMLGASACGYEAKVIRVVCPVDVAISRNIHGVPEEAIQGMASRIASNGLPPWWEVEDYQPE
jgi:predicted kinase